MAHSPIFLSFRHSQGAEKRGSFHLAAFGKKNQRVARPESDGHAVRPVPCPEYL